MDTLGALLSLYPVSSALTVRCQFGQPWALDEAERPRGIAPFHIVMAGAAILDGGNQSRTELAAGDIVVFPRGGSHRLYLADGDAVPAPARLASGEHHLRLMTNGAGGPTTELLCGEFRFDEMASASLLLALPEVMVVSTAGRADFAGLRALLDLLRIETAAVGADTASAQASAVVLGHLSSALFALLMRAWVERPGAVPGLFSLLAAPRLRAAVQVLLSCPERDWTVASLADLCHMSRATFARSFLRAGGAAPATVLTQLRMARAAQALLQQHGSTAEIAAAVGYQSEAAFNRGFKRVYGVGPGQFRREGRSGAA